MSQEDRNMSLPRNYTLQIATYTQTHCTMGKKGFKIQWSNRSLLTLELVCRSSHRDNYTLSQNLLEGDTVGVPHW